VYNFISPSNGSTKKEKKHLKQQTSMVVSEWNELSKGIIDNKCFFSVSYITSVKLLDI